MIHPLMSCTNVSRFLNEGRVCDRQGEALGVRGGTLRLPGVQLLYSNVQEDGGCFAREQDVYGFSCIERIYVV